MKKIILTAFLGCALGYAGTTAPQEQACKCPAYEPVIAMQNGNTLVNFTPLVSNARCTNLNASTGQGCDPDDDKCFFGGVLETLDSNGDSHAYQFSTSLEDTSIMWRDCVQRGSANLLDAQGQVVARVNTNCGACTTDFPQTPF